MAWRLAGGGPVDSPDAEDDEDEDEDEDDEEEEEDDEDAVAVSAVVVAVVVAEAWAGAGPRALATDRSFLFSPAKLAMVAFGFEVLGGGRSPKMSSIVESGKRVCVLCVCV